MRDYEEATVRAQYSPADTAVAEGQPVIARLLNLLDEELGRLGKQTDLLAERLHPVLGPNFPTEAKSSLSPVAEETGEIARVLNEYRDRINATYQRLQSVMTRLEI